MTTIEFNLDWKLKLQNRFINYVKIYSTSDAESEATPSTPQQWDIAKYIFEELKTLGLSDVSMDEHGYIYAYVPSNLEIDDEPVVGFISHYDTSPDFNGNTEELQSASHQMKKLEEVLINLMLKNLAQNGLTPWTAAKLVSWNMKTLMPQEQL